DRREILADIEEILETGWLTLGKHGRELEEKFAKYTGTKYALVNGLTSFDLDAFNRSPIK
ncbi:MAG: DegT/DnrJ/EryC1/StrS family aminotransferase, partial [Thermodesulfobacteriota bacterium]|nr:DegT/DnrJ/EryC1/StrS family aminotransferase [Thermodesulfobacteriota bacterium]